MSSKQLIECISYDDGFNWMDTAPTEEETDQNILAWVGSLLVYFQWKYKIDFRDWLKYFSTKDIYDMYYPLHEAAYEIAADKLWENYSYVKNKK